MVGFARRRPRVTYVTRRSAHCVNARGIMACCISCRGMGQAADGPDRARLCRSCGPARGLPDAGPRVPSACTVHLCVTRSRDTGPKAGIAEGVCPKRRHRVYNVAVHSCNWSWSPAVVQTGACGRCHGGKVVCAEGPAFHRVCNCGCLCRLGFADLRLRNPLYGRKMRACVHACVRAGGRACVCACK